MKYLSSILSPLFILSLVAILGGVGSIIFNDYPRLGAVLIMFGAFGTVWSYVSDTIASKESEAFHEAQATLLANSGIGNPYYEMVKIELEKKGHSSNAESNLIKALEIDPNNLDALSLLCPMLALHLSFQGLLGNSTLIDSTKKMWILAKALTDRGLKLSPKSHVFMDAMGIILDFEGNHKKAREYFSRSKQIRNDPFRHLMLATSFHMSGDHQKALQEIELAKEEGANGWLFDFYYGRALQANGDYQSAVNFLEKANQGRKWKFEIMHFLARTYFVNRNYFSSVRMTLLSSFCLIPVSFFQFFGVLLAGFLKAVLYALLKISRFIWPISKHVPLFSNLQLTLLSPMQPEFEISKIAIECKHFLVAESYLKDLITEFPLFAELYGDLAIASAFLGKQDEAMRQINKAIEIDPENKIYQINKKQFENGPPKRIVEINK